MWVERAMQWVKRPIKYRTTSSPEKLFVNLMLKQLALTRLYNAHPDIKTWSERQETLLRPVGRKDDGLYHEGEVVAQFLGSGKPIRNQDELAGERASGNRLWTYECCCSAQKLPHAEQQLLKLSFLCRQSSPAASLRRPRRIRRLELRPPLCRHHVGIQPGDFGRESDILRRQLRYAEDKE